jgi:hypothetical protein
MLIISFAEEAHFGGFSCLAGVPHCGLFSPLKWNSHSSKVEGIDPGFLRDFQVEVLDPEFLYAIHKHQAKISRFFIRHAVYHQCRSARVSNYKDILISVSQDESFGKKIVAPTSCIGSLAENGDVTPTFHGFRVMRGNETVNQSISCSFDPATLVCLSCGIEHPALSDKPIVIIMSDQNFVPSLGTNDGNCIQIVRLENASLMELFKLAAEMFGNVTLAEGAFSCSDPSHTWVETEPLSMLVTGRRWLHFPPGHGEESGSVLSYR